MIARLVSWLLRDAPDAAWAPTGIRRSLDTYDEQNAVAGALKARRHTPRGTLLPRPRPTNLHPFRKEGR